MKKFLRSGSALLFLAAILPAADLTFWVAPCTNPKTQCISGDIQLARWAFDAWQQASGGKLRLAPAEHDAALIRLVWAAQQEGLYGETMPIDVGGRHGAQIFVRIADGGTKDPLMRDTIVYLTCLHESGHALGLPHTANFDDIMYNFQYGGDIPEYFARYRRKLSSREDIRKNSGISPGDHAHLLDRVPAN